MSHGTALDEDNVSHEGGIPRGIGYYNERDSLSAAPRAVPGIQEVPEEGDVIPRGLGFYSGAIQTGEYQEAHLRDPKYYDWAYRLSYHTHPDYESRGKFFDEMGTFPCTSDGEPVRC